MEKLLKVAINLKVEEDQSKIIVLEIIIVINVKSNFSVS